MWELQKGPDDGNDVIKSCEWEKKPLDSFLQTEKTGKNVLLQSSLKENVKVNK